MEMNFQISSNPLDIESCNEWLRSASDGGVVLFVGNVRSANRGKEVSHLEFEAYEEMVVKELEKWGRYIQERFGVHKVLLHHRIEKVEIGETAVIAGIAAPHRKEAFEACSFLLEKLKTEIPIWKKEVYNDGHHWISATP